MQNYLKQMIEIRQNLGTRGGGLPYIYIHICMCMASKHIYIYTYISTYTCISWKSATGNSTASDWTPPRWFKQVLGPAPSLAHRSCRCWSQRLAPGAWLGLEMASLNGWNLQVQGAPNQPSHLSKLSVFYGRSEGLGRSNMSKGHPISRHTHLNLLGRSSVNRTSGLCNPQ